MTITVETVDGVEISEDATGFCPLRGGTAYTRLCKGCECNKGLFIFDENGKDFDSKYRILCAAPIPRKITTVKR